MSIKCISEILKKAVKMGVELNEREAGEIFRKIRETAFRYERDMASPQGFLKNMEPKKEAVGSGEELRQKIKDLSPQERVREYAKIAFDDMLNEKKEALRRRYLQIERNTDIEGKIKASPYDKKVKALNDITFSVEGRRNAIEVVELGDMYDALDKYMGFFGGKIKHEDALNVVREIAKPGSTTDANAKDLAKVWVKGRSAARLRKNELGADIGKLDDWFMPQAWDARGMKKAGKETWVNDAIKHIDRSRYWNETNGERLNDIEMKAVLADAWETITTDGLNKPVSAAQGQGSLAKRLGDNHRALHFKDADSWYAMAVKYGKKDIFNMMTSTIRKDAKDIAALEIFGPSPTSGFQTGYAIAKHLDKGEHVKWWEPTAQVYFNELNGTYNVPVNELFANTMGGIRKLLVSAKLGGVLLSQLNDISTYIAIARTDGLGIGKALTLARKSLNPLNKADQLLARRHGVLAQVVINDVAQRYGETVKGAGLTSRFANATVRLAGMEWWTNGMKQSYQLLIGAHLNDAIIAGDRTLDAGFKDMLERYGIGEKEWNIIKQAKPVDIMGESVITPTTVKMLGDTVEIRNAALKVAEMMTEEADVAIVSPGVRERAIMHQGTRPGTLSGEFMRSTALFKTFSLSLMTKVLPRIFNKKSLSTNRGIYTAAEFALGMMILGGVSYQLKEIAKGRNPRDISTAQFWLAAAAQSGGLGIFGDFLFSDVNRFGGGFTNTLAGPVAGLGEDISKFVIGNTQQALKGKKTDVAAEAIQLGKNYAPVINLWYARAAIDHALFLKIQEAANPGYLRRMKQRVEQGNNQTFWWKPNDTLPSSAPDMSMAVGGR